MSKRACELAELSFEELETRRAKIVDDPANANPARATGSIFLYTPQARRKLDDLAWAVTYKLQAKKKESA